MALSRGSVDVTMPQLIADAQLAAEDRETLHSSGDESGEREAERKERFPHGEEGERGTHALNDDLYWEPAEGVEQDVGVTKIESLYKVFGKGWGLYLLWASIGLISYAYALSQSTTYVYEQFATSAFGSHSLIGTISTITGIMAGVAQPFIAKLADIFSRPIALTVSVVFYFVGYAVVAGSKNVETVAGGMVIYTLGNTGISFMNGLLIADITSLQWRGFVQGIVSVPFVLNAFIAGFITEGIGALSANGWRWGYGMFCILIPVLISPAVAVLFIGDYRAKKIGALSLAAPSYYRAQVLAGMEVQKPSKKVLILRYFSRINAFGLLLLGFAFGCILTPFTLRYTAKGGYKNPSLIALLVVGGILFIAWVVWDGFIAKYPIMPRRVLNRTFMSVLLIDFFYYFSGYFIDTYWSSYVYVVVDWSDRDYAFYQNILTVMLCFFCVPVGLIMRYTHQYKWLQISGLAIRCLGVGLTYAATVNPTVALLVTSRVFTGLGGAISVITSQVASQGSVPHQDLAIAIAVLALWTQIGGAISSAISASVWTRLLPQNLEKYVGEFLDAEARAEIFGDLIAARAAEPRELVIKAYNETMRTLAIAALCTSFLGLAAGFFSKNYYLGDSHNNVEDHKVIRMRNKDEVSPEVVAARAREVQERIEREVQEKKRAEAETEQ